MNTMWEFIRITTNITRSLRESYEAIHLSPLQERTRTMYMAQWQTRHRLWHWLYVLLLLRMFCSTSSLSESCLIHSQFVYHQKGAPYVRSLGINTCSYKRVIFGLAPCMETLVNYIIDLTGAWRYITHGFLAFRVPLIQPCGSWYISALYLSNLPCLLFLYEKGKRVFWYKT